jgi:Protein of unknown function (DUF3775)
MTLSNVVKEVIALSEAAQVYWDRELPKRHPEYPIVRPGEDSGPPPEEEKKLLALLTGLPPDILYKLALIMALGRGAVTMDDLADRYEAMKDELGKPAFVVTQMLETAPLAEYLVDGLEELKRNHINVDKLLEAVPS